jgi:hypothetical protein
MTTFRPYRLGLGVFCTMLALTTSAGAQSNDEVYPNLQWNFSAPGARANGMGRTFIGKADDASAAVTNPAGLLSLTRPQVYGEFKNTKLTFERLADTDSLRTGRLRSTSRDITGVSFASVSVPVGSRLAVAFSLHRFLEYREDVSLADRDVPGTTPLSVTFPVNGHANFTATAFGGSVAYMVTNALRVGVTAAANRLETDTLATRTGTGRPGFPTPANIIVQQTSVNGSQMAMSVTVGLLFRLPDDKITVGGSYTKSPKFTVQENLQSNPGRLQTPAVNLPLVQSSGFPKPVEINVPDRLGAGIGIRPNSKLLVAGDIVRVNYSSLTKNTTIIFDPDVVLSTDFETPDVFELHAGVEYSAYSMKENTLLIRAGVFTDPAHLVRFVGSSRGDAVAFAFNNAAYRQAGKDKTRGTVGAGLVLGRRSQIDVAYAFGGDFVASAAVRF